MKAIEPDTIPSLPEEEWRSVSIEIAQDRYKVSNLGRVKRIDAKSKLWTLNNLHKNSDGYMSTFMYDAKGKGVTRLVHRLVALTFIPWKHLPLDIPTKVVSDPCPYEPNHKNGVKTDNRIENLEWATHQRQIDHAIETRLVKHNTFVRVEDLVLGTSEVYTSVNKVIKALGIPSTLIRFLMKSGEVFKNRYKLSVEDQGVGGYTSKMTHDILVLDYVTKTTTIYGSIYKVSVELGIRDGVIKRLISNQDDNYLAGYDFYSLNNIDMDNPPEFKDIDMPEKDREEYYTYILSGKYLPPKKVNVLDLTTNEVKTYDSIDEVKELALPGFYNGTFHRHIKDMGKPLFSYDDRWVFKLEDDTRDWSEAVPYINNNKKSVIVKDLQDGSETEYRSLMVAAESLGLNYSTLRTTLQVNLDLPLRIMYDRYIFKHYNDTRSFDDAKIDPREGLSKSYFKKVERTCMTTGERVEYISLSEAARANNTSLSNMHKKLNNRQPIDNYLYSYC
jgi:hypothetical protein